MDTAQSARGSEFMGSVKQGKCVRSAAIDSQTAQGFFAPVGAFLASLDMPVGMSLVNSGSNLGDVNDRHLQAARFFNEPLIKPRAAQRHRRDLQVGVAGKNEKVDSRVVAWCTARQNLPAESFFIACSKIQRDLEVDV